ncbi:MAG: hypothetical protein JKY31_13125 [Rhodobacteraceae bacterium]|nr:hypothetical protein [Paracoccaceae bacterium]
MQPQNKFSVVDVSELPEYPLDENERLESHSFFLLHYDRWLESEFRLKSSLESRGAAIDLFSLSQRQTPVGTLPNDDVQLAKLLHITLEHWLRLKSANDSPLYKWTLCRCGSKVRLMHPVVTEVVLKAFDGKRANLDRAEAGRERKRMNDLRGTIERVGSKSMAHDESIVLRVKAWLAENVSGNWTTSCVARALEAISLNSFH